MLTGKYCYLNNDGFFTIYKITQVLATKSTIFLRLSIADKHVIVNENEITLLSHQFQQPKLKNTTIQQ